MRTAQWCVVWCVAVLVSVHGVQAATNYVALDGLHVAPFTNWVTAATNIQAAVDVALDGAVVLVAPGDYKGTQQEISDNMVALTKAVRVESVAGPAATIINGAGWHRRCVYISHPEAVVYGFTMLGGYARTNWGPQVYPVSCGGGVFADGAGTLENCILYFNRAGLLGGQAYLQGGGALRNCLIVGGQAAQCGGVYATNGGVVESCTIVDNSTLLTNLAGGMWCVNGGAVTNSVFYGNRYFDSNLVAFVAEVSTFGAGWSFAYTRVAPAIAGAGNITNDPLFADALSANYRLSPLSPCDGAGIIMPWMATAVDLDGGPRIQKGAVDMGAYETPGVYYVAPNGAHQTPFATWAQAATSIIAALQVAAPGTTIVVSNGTYALDAMVEIGTNLIVRSLAGAAATMLDGQGVRTSVRVDHVDAVLDGFTLTGGVGTNQNGGGVRVTRGTARNCIITRNYAAQLGGGAEVDPQGILENCIVTDNEAGWGGAGVFMQGGGLVRNCEIARNTTPALPLPPALGGVRLGGGGIFLLSGGEVDSSTIAYNMSGYEGGGVLYADLFGPVTSVLRNTIVQLNSAASNGANYAGARLTWQNCCTAPAVPPGQDAGGNISADPRFVAGVPGVLRLRADSPCRDAGSNMMWMAGAVDLLGNARVLPGTVDMGAYELPAVHYVAPAGSHSSPFTNWVSAATTIVAAVNVACDGSVVLINDGTYTPDDQTFISSNISVMSLNGPGNTIIDGRGGVARLVTTAPAAVVDGLTITNCTAPMADMGPVGAGFGMAGGILQNSVLAGNVAGAIGGGVYIDTRGGTLYNCRITGNAAYGGGGGGIAMIGGLGRVWNCVIDRNVQTGVFFGLVSGGAGVLAVGGGEFVSSTIAGNVSSNEAGGLYYAAFPPMDMTGACRVVNCIVYDNSAGGAGANYLDFFAGYHAGWQFSCTAPALTNVSDLGGNVYVAPGFADSAQGNYHLQFSSPCREAGSNMAWMAYAYDLDGTPRVVGSTVDMGAYEFIPEPLCGGMLALVVLWLRRRYVCGR